MNLPPRIGLIGFGEAASAFAEAWVQSPPATLRAYDRRTDDPATRDALVASYTRLGVPWAPDARGAIGGAEAVLSLVTADQALHAARSGAAHLRPGALWLDMNSVAPATKRLASDAVTAAGGRYVDVAVMAPVRPALLGVPLLLAGVHADAGLALLRQLGFSGQVVGEEPGRAAGIKMIRSIAVKGLEAVVAECVLTAYAAGVQDEVLASLDRSDPGLGWHGRAAYTLERMMRHGRRRADEMDEAAQTVSGYGLDPGMSRATAAWQRRIGTLEEAPGCDLSASVTTILAALEGSPT